MKIEEENEQEGKGNNEPSNGMSQDDMNLIHQLTKRIAQLESNQQAPQVGGGLSESFMVEFLNKLNAPKPSDDGQFSFNQMHSASDIDENDVLDEKEQVMFFSHRVMYVIVDDKRAGRNVPAPYDKIIFKYFTHKRVRNGKETDIMNISTYICKSRTELEWLKNHSMYNVLFFENINSALSTNADRSARLARQIISMQNMGQHDVLQTAKSRGIEISNDVQAMKIKIAETIVDEQIKRERHSFEKIVQENEAEKAIFEN